MNISNEKFLRKLLGASISGIYIYDLRLGRNVYVNDQYTRITGYELEDINAMTGLQFFELFHPEDRQRVSEHFENISRGVETTEIEYRFKINEGGWIWCLSRDQIFDRSEDGSVRQFIGSFIEITKLKRTEEELHESRAHLSWVLERTGIGTWLNELPLGRLNWDETTKRLFFVSPDEEPAIDLFWSRIYPGDREATRTAVEKAVSEGTLYSIDHRAVNPDTSEIRWIRSMGQASYAKNGTPTRFDGINFDISELKNNEDALLESRTLFQNTFENAAVGMAHISLDGHLVRVNQKMSDIVGYSQRELLKKTFQEITHPEDLQTDLDLTKQLIKGKIDSFELEKRYIRKDGSIVWVHLSASMQKNNNLGIAVIQDISEQKNAEEALRQLNETLERRVAERTAIAEKRAYQLQQLALELSTAEDRERQQIAQILHDDLQQYLASLRFQLQMYLPEKADDQYKQKLIQLVDETIQKCRSLSHELSPPVLHQIGLLAALNWLASDIQKKHGLYVEFVSQSKAEPESPELASMLFRSVRELLFNIIKHSGVDSAIVEAGLLGNRIRISVKDEGKGFDPVAIEARDGVMSGFGLFTIKERVMLMRGRFDIESAPGKGCSVILEIPKKIRKKKFSGQVESSAINIQNTPVSQIQSSKVRILLADDHAVMRQGLSNILNEKEDFEIVGEAVNGQEAVRLAKELNPDIILMDVSMPEMDGIEATMHISKVLPHTRIIGLSMHDDDETRDRMINAGASAYIYKACQAEELIEVIRGNLR